MIPSTHEALVGRDPELAGFEELLDALDRGPQLVRLVGEAGIGKTRLLAELLSRARQRGHVTLWGRASEFERDVPFAVLVDALGSPELELGEPLGRLPQSYRRELTAVLPPSLAAHPVSAEAPPPTSERYLLHRAFAALLETLAEESRVVVALDDLHWADEASMEVLVHLVERPPAGVFVALAYRPRQLPPGPARALDGAAASAGRRLELRPLTWEQARDLLPGDLPEEAARRAWEASAGNPFYLEQLVRAAQDGALDDQLPTDEPHTGTVPGPVAAATARELAMLADGARQVLDGAAVAGDPFETELAAAAAGVSHDLALEAIDELLGRDVVRPIERLGRFRFRHPLLRQAVYEQARATWRLGAHRRVADALAARGAPAVVRARHVELYAQSGDCEAVEILEDAARTAMLRAPGSAARWYGAALELLGDAPGQAQRRQQNLTGRAITLGYAGRLSESSQAFATLLEELALEAPERPVAVRFAALVAHLLGHHDEAQRLVLGQLERLAPETTEAHQLQLEMAYGGFLAADWQAVHRWASAALDGEVNETLRAAGLSLLAIAQYSLGQTADAQHSAAGARELVDALSDMELLERVEAVSMLAWAEFCTEHVDASLAHTERGMRICQEYGQGHLIVAMQVVQALGLLVKGAFARAGDIAEDAIDSSRLSGNTLFLTWALTTRCDVALQAGDPQHAVELGQQAQRAGADSHSPWVSVAGPYLAEAWLEAGRPDRCLETLLDADDQPRLPPFPYYVPRCYATLARAERQRGRLDRAHRWAALADQAGEALGLAGAQIVGRRCKAELALAEDQPDRALTLAREGMVLAQRAHLPVEVGRCRVVAGQALAATDHQRAVDELARAHEELAAQGATRYRDQAAQRLGELEGAVPPAIANTDDALATLSRREREVAELVAQGHTNKAIGAQLGLSPSTINNHLVRVFARLGINSRGELAALWHHSRHP